MHIVYSDHFLREARHLPLAQKRKLSRLMQVLETEPFHSLLHTKPLAGTLTGLYSFRITRDWRVIFQFVDPHTIRLVTVGHRKEIYAR